MDLEEVQRVGLACRQLERRVGAAATGDPPGAKVRPHLQYGPLFVEEDRVGLPQAKNLAVILSQSESLGTDAVRILREYADNMRTNMRQRADEMANKAPFKLLFPAYIMAIGAAILVISPPVLEISRIRSSNLLDIDIHSGYFSGMSYGSSIGVGSGLSCRRSEGRSWCRSGGIWSMPQVTMILPNGASSSQP